MGDDDYNMDENEAESETDKQAALVWNDQKLNGKDGADGFPFISCCDDSQPGVTIIRNPTMLLLASFGSFFLQAQWRREKIKAA